MIKTIMSRFFYNKKGQEADNVLSLRQLVYLIMFILLLVILFAIIPSLKKILK